MNKSLFYIIVVTLYLLTPFCIMFTLGIMVSKKYEVDESYWHIDGNKKLSEEQKRQEVENLDEKGRQLDYKTYALTLLALTTFITATGLIIKRNKILTKQKSSS